MSTSVDPSDWGCLDPWWSAYAETRLLPRSSIAARVLGREQVTNFWSDLDAWWQMFADSVVLGGSSTVARELMGNQTEFWEELDPWWEVYTETGHATAGTIADLLNRSSDQWRQSNAPFNTDPLAADLTFAQIQRGPLQPRNEVGWSRWLARLLAPSPALVVEVFDVEVTQPPEEVLREDQLQKEDGSIRRPDILLCYPDHGISIEVKLEDENYRKTAETAALVEHHYPDREWTHTLLLPHSKLGRLEAIVGPSIMASGGQPQIDWVDPGPVAVKHWRDVTAGIRSLLRQGTIVDDHWAANAYLFCAVAEQRLMNFQPQPVVERMNAPANVVDAIRPIQFSRVLEEQLTYLREVVDI